MGTKVKYDAHYAASDKACGDPFEPFVEFASALSPPASVLDLGCGQGRDALLFARAGHSVVGVDLSSVGVAQLRERAQAEGLDVQAEVGDVVTYVPDKVFDVVLLDRVLHMLPTESARAVVLAMAAEATHDGGWVLVSEYPKQLPQVRSFFEAGGWTLARDARGFVFAQRVDRDTPAPE
jgi:tellurite methyltransferase